jgi:hypothetical protein
MKNSMFPQKHLICLTKEVVDIILKFSQALRRSNITVWKTFVTEHIGIGGEQVNRINKIQFSGIENWPHCHHDLVFCLYEIATIEHHFCFHDCPTYYLCLLHFSGL